MNRSIFDEDPLDSAEEIGYVPSVRNMPRSRKTTKLRPPRPRIDPTPPPMTVQQADEEETFRMSYKASRYEAIWLEEALTTFFQHKWFDDVLRVVKGGKEATVYLCEGNATTGEEFLAAKVYRPRKFRNLRNDFLYREGRSNLDESGNAITNKGMLHAMRKRTEYGRELLHTSWLEHEYQTLQALHEAGADVPKPYASDSNTILMRYYGDEVMGAPTLNDVNLPPAEARTLFERIMHNIELMLSLGRIHGDLSAFNILYWEGQIAIIDFPQAVRPDENRSAFRIFERDVVRVCEYFTRQRAHIPNPRKTAADLWAKYNQRFVPLVDPKMLGEDDDSEREIWESLKNS